MIDFRKQFLYKQIVDTQRKGESMKGNKQDQPFKNVALLPEDHAMLKKISDADQRTMTRQLSVIIRREFENLESTLRSKGVSEW